VILIADSGSTTTDWCLINKDGLVKSINTQGINPFMQTGNEILQLLDDCSLNKEFASTDNIAFYGAGCINNEKKEIVKSALRTHFDLSNIEVESDLLAAARGLCGTEQGIACILGTGSNSCYFDGKQIVKNVSPLGYILGDEGSGAVLGKKLLGDVLKNQLPQHVIEQFNNHIKMDASELMNRVYRQPFPNRFLASLTTFIKANLHEPLVYQLVFEEFRLFVKRNLMQYKQVNELPVHFTGSIAFHFSSVLKGALDAEGVKMGGITQNPIEGLIQFHQLNE
jgi:N-acetylglucosamine kinase-like BadF-type ATPase